MSAAATITDSSPDSAKSFLLQRAQPAMTGLIDGSLSTLAPIFAVALATHQPRYAFFAGLATAIGAGVSMAFSEGLSDDGELTGRGNAYLRGSITGAGTFLGLDESVSDVLPVVSGSNALFLNGHSDCAAALWGPINFTALSVNHNPTATVTAP